MKPLLTPLDPSFYRRDTVSVARALLGTLLCCNSDGGLAAGIIVETEAYLSRNDPACHASRGQTRRNAPMFGPPGRAYIYFIYGSHYCFNVVTAPAGIGEAVLIRALEPVEGLALMRRRRIKARQAADLTNGPGKLCQALAIDGAFNEHELCRPPLWIAAGGEIDPAAVVRAPRIGISRAVERELRFYLKNNRYVSRRIEQG